MFKNVASQKVTLFAFDATTNLPKTGDAANITPYYSLDDGTVTVLASPTATEADATNAKGYYTAALAQGETNGNKILFSAKSSTSNIVVIAVPAIVYPVAANFSSLSIDSSGRVDVIKVNGTSQTARDLGASVLLSSGTGTGQVSLASGVVLATDALGNALATASAVANIAVTSAALNQTAASRSITTGTGSGGVANTTAADLVYDSVADVTGTLDFYYQFDISGTSGSAAVGVEWLGYVVGVVNTIKVYAYNWGGASWDQIGTIVGIAGTTNQAQEWELTSAHTGTAGNLGLVRIRFSATGLTTATVKTDRMLLGYAVVPTFPTNFSSLAITGGGAVTAGTVSDKTGYSLAATGLDALTTTEPDTVTNGAMSTWNFRLLLRWLVSCMSNGTRTLSGGTGTLTVKKLGGTTATAQTIADDGVGNETLGAPT